MVFSGSVINHAILTAGGVFLASAVFLPLDRRYRAWKSSRGEVTLRRDWRGRLVPDLTIKRIERAALIALGLIAVLGFVGILIIETGI